MVPGRAVGTFICLLMSISNVSNADLISKNDRPLFNCVRSINSLPPEVLEKLSKEGFRGHQLNPKDTPKDSRMVEGTKPVMGLDTLLWIPGEYKLKDKSQKEVSVKGNYILGLNYVYFKPLKKSLWPLPIRGEGHDVTSDPQARRMVRIHLLRFVNALRGYLVNQYVDCDNCKEKGQFNKELEGYKGAIVSRLKACDPMQETDPDMYNYVFGIPQIQAILGRSTSAPAASAPDAGAKAVH